MRLFSCGRVWERTFAIGVGMGCDPSDHSACVFFQLGLWVLTIGPHNPVGDSDE